MIDIEKSNKQQTEVQQQLLDFVSYVLTSTKGLYREPQSYGPMRMIDSLEKSLVLLKQVGVDTQSLDNAMSKIREDRWRATSDPEAFAEAIDGAIHELVKVTIGK